MSELRNKIVKAECTDSNEPNQVGVISDESIRLMNERIGAT
jgi:hypothetical protein